MTDITEILTNVATSLDPFERMIGGVAYMMGILFIFKALKMLGNFGKSRSWGKRHGEAFQPLALIGIGVALFYLPTAMSTFMTSVFGYQSPLAYSTLTEFLIAKYGSVTIVVLNMIKVAGLFWFILGMSMLAQAAKPGRQQGMTALGLIVGGIMAFNVNGTIDVLGGTLNLLLEGTLGGESSILSN